MNVNIFAFFVGLFSSSGMSYDVAREAWNRTHEPTLSEMVEKAVEILSKNPKGFFLIVEGARKICNKVLVCSKNR